MSEIKTTDRKTLPWSAKQLIASMKKGTAIYTSACQRSLVWNDKQKSLLIHSMITNCPIPPMYAVKTEGGVYSFLDGKQRSNSIREYMDDEFSLVDVPPVEYDDGTETDINGKVFSNLPEDMKDNIKTYSFCINVLEGLDDEEVNDIFYRLNNGSALKTIESIRVKCKSLEKIQKVADHPILRTTLTDKAKARYTDEDIVIKSYIMLTDNPCLDLKFVQEFTSNLELSTKDIELMENIYSKLWTVRDKMENEKAKKKMLTRTHLITLVGFMKDKLKEKDQKVADFIDKFYGTPKATSISEKYNDRCKSGSNHKENVLVRLEELDKVWKGKKTDENNTEE